jgi:hypothetical protein
MFDADLCWLSNWDAALDQSIVAQNHELQSFPVPPLEEEVMVLYRIRRACAPWDTRDSGAVYDDAQNLAGLIASLLPRSARRRRLFDDLSSFKVKDGVVDPEKV